MRNAIHLPVKAEGSHIVDAQGYRIAEANSYFHAESHPEIAETRAKAIAYLINAACFDCSHCGRQVDGNHDKVFFDTAGDPVCPDCFKA